ncbi:MAG: hypothetical protein AAFX06_09510 [Planctomycetota bacterium]
MSGNDSADRQHLSKSAPRFRFGLRTLLASAAVVCVAIGLFVPRYGESLDGCSNQGLDSVWIAPPDLNDVVTKCRAEYPGIAVPDNPPVIIEKVFEEVGHCCFCNFHGRRYVHRVRYRCEVFPAAQFPGQSLVVMFDFDHYHLNGGGCEMRLAEVAR